MDAAEVLSRPDLAEESDGYVHVVAHLNADWRVIRCRAGIQWIIQRRRGAGKRVGGRWQSLRYHRSRATLIEAVTRLCSDVSAAGNEALRALPEWVEA